MAGLSAAADQIGIMDVLGCKSPTVMELVSTGSAAMRHAQKPGE